MKNILFKIYQRIAFNSIVSEDYEKALKYLLKIKSLFPERQGVDFNIGLVKFGQGKYEEAEYFFLKDLELYGESYQRFKALGDLYYIWGKREKAEDFYFKSIRLVENKKDKRLLKERISKCKSEKSFRRVQESNKKYMEGNNLFKDNLIDKALSCFEEAGNLDNTNFLAWNNQGTIYLNHKNDYEKALYCFQKALEFSDLPVILKNKKRVEKIVN